MHSGFVGVDAAELRDQETWLNERARHCAAQAALYTAAASVLEAELVRVQQALAGLAAGPHRPNENAAAPRPRRRA